MMRIASLYSKFKRPLCGAALLLLAGCAGTQDGGVDAPADAVSVPVAVETAQTEIPETFTTVGKPTKTIETPWGPREIYDPGQDQAVVKAIRSLYELSDTSFGEVARIVGFGNLLRVGQSASDADTYTSTDRYIKTIKTARRTHYYDMLRLGCRQAAEVPCQYFGSFYFIQKCPDSNFGSMHLTSCEQKNLTSDYTDIGGPIVFPPPNQSNLKGADPKYHYTAYTCVIDGIENEIQGPLLIGGVSGYDLEQTERLLTNVECLEWQKP